VHIRTGAVELFLEALALLVTVGGVAVLSHSQLIADEDGPPAGEAVRWLTDQDKRFVSDRP
jgi:hypothetical protein